MKLIYCLYFCLFSLLTIQFSFAQDEVNWEDKLEDCEVKMKIKGSSKHENADHQFAEKYKDVEIIWLHFEKSMKKADTLKPVRVYLVSEKLKNGSHAEYIIHKEDKAAGINAPIFLDWKSKKNRFYLAECFDKVFP